MSNWNSPGNRCFVKHLEQWVKHIGREELRTESLLLLLLLLSHSSRATDCATPSLGFSRQEHWSGLPFPSPTESLSPSIFSVWIQFSHTVVFNSLWPHGMQHTRLTCPLPIPGTSSNSCPSSQWCHRAISSSAIPFSSCLQPLPGSDSFPMSQFFTSGGQSIRASALAAVLPMNIQDWCPLRWTGWISLQYKGLSRVFSNTTVKKH